MEIDDYINNKDNNIYEEISEKKETPKTEATSKKKKVKISKSQPTIIYYSEEEKHELSRKRDILASVALLDGLESYIGENISAAQIRNMKKEKIESYFILYQEKAGQEVTNDMMSSLIEISVKGLSYMVDIDNEEDLKNDLINNKQLRRTVGRQAAEIAEKYGDFVAIAKVLFTVGKHLTFSSGESSTPVESTSIPKELPNTTKESKTTTVEK